MQSVSRIRRIDLEATRWSLALACGVARSSEEAAASAPWQAVLSVATRERLVALCWARSADVIRRHASPEVRDAWRGRAVAELLAGERRLNRLRDLLSVLAAANVSPVLLKGMGLGARLYGDARLRPAADVDLYIAQDEWARADAALREVGWKRQYGEPPRETAYRRATRDHGREVLELHCSLSDDGLLAHLELPAPSSRLVQLSDYPVHVHDGDSLPAYLAVHLAKRSHAPLLWLVDLHTLWHSLSDDERADARDWAQHTRVSRYLTWALARADAVHASAMGDTGALAALLAARTRWRSEHNAVRILRLSSSPTDALRVAGAWVWPRDMRASPVHYLHRMRDRAVKLVTPASRSHATVAADSPPERALLLRTPIAEFVVDVVGRGGAMWIRATGRSMQPAIEPGTRVRLVPRSHAALRPGAVVLARLPDGATVLHRIIAASDAGLRLCGDNAARPDAMVGEEAVLGVADLMEHGGKVIPISPQRRGTLRRTLRNARTIAHSLVRARTVRPVST